MRRWKETQRRQRSGRRSRSSWARRRFTVSSSRHKLCFSVRSSVRITQARPTIRLAAKPSNARHHAFGTDLVANGTCSVFESDKKKLFSGMAWRRTSLPADGPTNRSRSQALGFRSVASPGVGSSRQGLAAGGQRRDTAAHAPAGQTAATIYTQPRKRAGPLPETHARCASAATHPRQSASGNVSVRAASSWQRLPDASLSFEAVLVRVRSG